MYSNMKNIKWYTLFQSFFSIVYNFLIVFHLPYCYGFIHQKTAFIVKLDCFLSCENKCVLHGL